MKLWKFIKENVIWIALITFYLIAIPVLTTGNLDKKSMIMSLSTQSVVNTIVTKPARFR